MCSLIFEQELPTLLIYASAMNTICKPFVFSVENLELISLFYNIKMGQDSVTLLSKPIALF